MKIKLELFGASRDFSNKDHLELNVKDKASIDDLRNEIIKYIEKNFQGNENFIKVHIKEISSKVKNPQHFVLKIMK